MFTEKQRIIANRYDLLANMDILQEECGELIKAISKYKRATNPKLFPTPVSKEKAIADIKEESVDVQICIENIRYFLGMSDEEVSNIKDEKASRTIKRMEEADGLV